MKKYSFSVVTTTDGIITTDEDGTQRFTSNEELNARHFTGGVSAAALAAYPAGTFKDIENTETNDLLPVP